MADNVVVVGAGVVGLSCAIFLSQRGLRVTVLDQSGVAAGASWGNAGYITPDLSGPLTTPATLLDAARSSAVPHRPVRMRATPGVIRFVSAQLLGVLAGRHHAAAYFY